jgi:hypothetical protein
MPHLLALGESLFGHNHPVRVILLNNAAEKNPDGLTVLARIFRDIERGQALPLSSH